MKGRKSDRRSQRTQRLLGEALIALLREKRYEDITVQDILARADIGRATFYEHYWDKEDLLSSEIEQVIDVLGQHLDESSQSATHLIPALALFEHVRQQQPLFQALWRGKGLQVAIQAFSEHLRERVKTQLREQDQSRNADELLSAVSSYVAGSFMTLMQWWLETEMAWSPERMDALYRQLVLPGVQQFLRRENAKHG